MLFEVEQAFEEREEIRLFPKNVCVGGYALSCKKLKMFLLSHSLFSVLVCRLLFQTFISKTMFYTPV